MNYFNKNVSYFSLAGIVKDFESRITPEMVARATQEDLQNKQRLAADPVLNAKYQQYLVDSRFYQSIGSSIFYNANPTFIMPAPPVNPLNGQSDQPLTNRNGQPYIVGVPLNKQPQEGLFKLEGFSPVSQNDIQNQYQQQVKFIQNDLLPQVQQVKQLMPPELQQAQTALIAGNAIPTASNQPQPATKQNTKPFIIIGVVAVLVTLLVVVLMKK